MSLLNHDDTGGATHHTSVGRWHFTGEDTETLRETLTCEKQEQDLNSALTTISGLSQFTVAQRTHLGNRHKGSL